VNAGQLPAWFEANKKPVLGVAAAGVAGLALMRARKRTAGATAGGLSSPAVDTALATGPAIAGTVPYDSSAIDGYNDLQNQIYKLTDQQQQQSPVPVPEYKPGFYQNLGSGRIYQLDASGNADWLSPSEFKSLGGNAKNVTKVAKDNTFWTSVTRVDPKEKTTA